MLDDTILAGQLLIILGIGAWWLWKVHRVWGGKCPWVKGCSCRGHGAPPDWSDQ